jgi:hypothetical protein
MAWRFVKAQGQLNITFTYWIGGWVGPRASLDAVGKRKLSCPFWDSNPCCPSRSLVAVLSEQRRFRIQSVRCLK